MGRRSFECDYHLRFTLPRHFHSFSAECSGLCLWHILNNDNNNINKRSHRRLQLHATQRHDRTHNQFQLHNQNKEVSAVERKQHSHQKKKKEKKLHFMRPSSRCAYSFAFFGPRNTNGAPARSNTTRQTCTPSNELDKKRKTFQPRSARTAHDGKMRRYATTSSSSTTTWNELMDKPR